MDTLVMSCPGTSTNTTLHKIGEVCCRFSGMVSGDVGAVTIVKTAKSVLIEARIVGDLEFTDSTGSASLGKATSLPTSELDGTIYVKGTDGLVFISNKYAIVGFTLPTSIPTSVKVSYPSADFSYMSRLARIRLYRTTEKGERLDLAQLKNSPITNITTGNYGGFYGDIANVAKSSNLTLEFQCQGYEEDEPWVYGDLSSLSRSVNITTLTLNYTKVLGDVSNLASLTKLASLNLAYTGISGSISDMLDAMVAAGRTSGSLVIRAGSSSVTYDGAEWSRDRTITFSTSDARGWHSN